jgi:hypothetical protein
MEVEACRADQFGAAGHHPGPNRTKGDGPVDTLTPQPPAPQNLNRKQLKALAKASRPWYAKKRFWVLGGVVGIIVIASANSQSGNSGTSKEQNGGVSTLSNNSSSPPQADVAIESCTVDAIGFPKAKLRITNHSSGRSDYMIQVNFLDGTGTKVAEGAAISNNIDAGQSAIETAGGLTEVKGALTCKVTDVNRFASH